MVKYILKRLFQSLVVILLVVCVVFFLLRLMPSDYFFTEDELMKFTESQKYAKLERLGMMEICPSVTAAAWRATACPACRGNRRTRKGRLCGPLRFRPAGGFLLQYDRDAGL